MVIGGGWDTVTVDLAGEVCQSVPILPNPVHKKAKADIVGPALPPGMCPSLYSTLTVTFRLAGFPTNLSFLFRGFLITGFVAFGLVGV